MQSDVSVGSRVAIPGVNVTRRGTKAASESSLHITVSGGARAQVYFSGRTDQSVGSLWILTSGERCLRSQILTELPKDVEE